MALEAGLREADLCISMTARAIVGSQEFGLLGVDGADRRGDSPLFFPGEEQDHSHERDQPEPNLRTAPEAEWGTRGGWGERFVMIYQFIMSP